MTQRAAGKEKLSTIHAVFATFAFGAVSAFLGGTQQAWALELDWSGQFRSDINYVGNYLLDASDAAANVDPTRQAAGGYYITPGGSHDVTFETLFLRLRPKLVVNDNIYIKSEWWLGNPIFGLFGSGAPNAARYRDMTQYYSSQNGGSSITAQRFWGEFVTDFGTFQIGRAPLQWGLGVVWNAGDGVWDYYQSTGDTIRWVAKFGKFSLIPAYVAYGIGTVNGNPAVGATSSTVSDVSVALKYEDPDNETEAGVNAIRRFGSSGQTTYYVLSPAVGGDINYTLWDIYAKKTFGRLSLGAEVPIVSGGDLSGISYSSWAVAAEAKFRQSDTFQTELKAGYVPGQQDFTGASPGSYGAFYFNPGYSLGMMFFNDQFANFATGGSPYDNPLTNAVYAQLAETWHIGDKWAWKVMGTYANAIQTATAGQNFFNTWSRSPGAPAATGYAAVGNQSSNLGFELATDLAFQWDEFFTFRLDLGYFWPGAFYAFSNAATPNATDPTFGAAARVGVNF